MNNELLKALMHWSGQPENPVPDRNGEAIRGLSFRWDKPPRIRLLEIKFFDDSRHDVWFSRCGDNGLESGVITTESQLLELLEWVKGGDVS